MKRLKASILAIAMTASLIPSAQAEEKSNPLAIEQVLISENFDRATITRPVTGSNIPVRIKGADRVTYNTTDWGKASRQSALIEGGAYVQRFVDVSEYQINDVVAKPVEETPINLGDELHISFDYKYTGDKSSNLKIELNDENNIYFRPYESSFSYIKHGAGKSGLVHFDRNTFRPGSSSYMQSEDESNPLVLTPNKQYEINIIIKTKDAKKSDNQTMYVEAVDKSTGETYIYCYGKLDMYFSGILTEGTDDIAKDDAHTDLLTSFKSLTFAFANPKAVGDMVVDNVSVKKLRNGYSIDGDAMSGVIPDGFGAGSATVSLGADSASGDFIVAQYDARGRLITVNTQPVEITDKNRVEEQDIVISADTKKITGFFWDGVKPITENEDLAVVKPRKSGTNPDTFALNFDDANGDYFTDSVDTPYEAEIVDDTFAKTGNSLAFLNTSTESNEFAYISLTPARLYPSQSDTTVLGLSLASFALNSEKSIKASAYDDDGYYGEVVDLVNIRTNGRLSILGYNVKLDEEMVSFTDSKWYSLKLYINNADLENGVPNTFSAYLDGQLVLEDKPFPVNGNVFNNWYGFSEIMIGSTALSGLSDCLYIDDISYGIDNAEPVNSVVDSVNPYYVNLIDNAKGVVYDGGQDFADFASDMRLEGVSDPEFVNSDQYLKMTDIKGGDIYYKVVALPEDMSKYAITDEIDVNNAYNPDLTNYYEYVQPTAITKGSPLDMSWTLDAPAGKHGVVKAQGDGFVFEDGTPVEFWGTNIGGSGAFPDTYEEAERIADSVAAAGFNLVRFHNIDGPFRPNVFGYGTDATKLDDTAMDKLCYLMKCLKDRGIYFYVDQTCYLLPDYCTGKVGNAEPLDTTVGVEMGLKPIAYFDDKAIEIQKEYSRMLLTYQNPHTGMSLAEDPAMALIDLNNEFSMPNDTWFESVLDDNGKITGYEIKEGREYYYNVIRAQYNKWLKEVKYPGDTETLLKEAWGSTYPRTPYFPNESIADGTVEFIRFYTTQSGQSGYYYSARLNDEELFIKYVMENYLSERILHLHGLGVGCPITGNTVFGDSKVQIAHTVAANTDFVDNHIYWGHPSGALDEDGTPLTTLNRTNKRLAGNISQLEADGDGENLGMIGTLASDRVLGKPYVISEWLGCAGTLTHAESPILMSAFASMHGWNPVAFAWNSRSNYVSNLEDGYAPRLSDGFAMIENPVMRSLFPAAALMFNRDDVSEAESGYYARYDNDNEIYIGQGANKYGNQVWLGGNYSKNLAIEALMGKTGVSYYNVDSDEYGSDAFFEIRTSATNTEGVYTSETEELVTDLNDSIFKVDTKKSQAVSGYIGEKEIKLSNIIFEIQNNFAAGVLTSLTENDIVKSDKMLLTLAGNCVNHGQLLSEDGTKIRVGGTGNILTEQIVGKITLKGLSGTYKVYSLTPSGDRKAEIPVTTSGSNISFTLTKDTKAMSFEIVKQ